MTRKSLHTQPNQFKDDRLKKLTALKRPTPAQFKDRYRKSMQATIEKGTGDRKDVLTDVMNNEIKRFMKLS